MALWLGERTLARVRVVRRPFNSKYKNLIYMRPGYTLSHRIFLHAQWGINEYLRSGRRCQVPENYATPPVNIYAVYPQRLQKVRRASAFFGSLSNRHHTRTKCQRQGRHITRESRSLHAC
jgi:hypothetical protein